MAIAEPAIRKTRAEFDPDAAPAKSANDALAEIRRMAQWRIDIIQRACRDRPPSDDELDALAKAGKLLISLDRPVTEPVSRERRIDQLSDEELARASR